MLYEHEYKHSYDSDVSKIRSPNFPFGESNAHMNFFDEEEYYCDKISSNTSSECRSPKYEMGCIDRMINRLDFIKQSNSDKSNAIYELSEKILTTNKKAVYVVKDKYEKKYVMKVKLSDFMYADQKNVYLKIKKNPHPNINSIVSIYQTDKFLIVISEFVDGYVFSNAKKALEYDNNLENIFTQCLNGLEHLHKLDIVHGDISPNNIVITKINDEYKPIIIDFDLSRNVSGESIHSTSISGTRFFISPEKRMGIISKQSDFWSLCVTFCYHIIKPKQFQKEISSPIPLSLRSLSETPDKQTVNLSEREIEASSNRKYVTTYSSIIDIIDDDDFDVDPDYISKDVLNQYTGEHEELIHLIYDMLYNKL